MTRTANARIAGAAFLLYIAAGVAVLQMAAGHVTPLGFVESLCAFALGVTLFALTRDVDPDLARMGLVCRVAEGILGAAGAGFVPSGFFFAVGSTLFAWLLLRGRIVPAAIAWTGVAGSLLLVIGLPLVLLNMLTGAPSKIMWAPVAVFEVTLAVWFLWRGARTPLPRTR